MILNKKPVMAIGIRFSIEDCGVEIARGRLYILNNDLHGEPFGLVEDLFVDENRRSSGYGSKIVKKMIEEARKLRCYKIIATSRKSREYAHRFYEKNGFENYGYEFRFNLN